MPSSTSILLARLGWAFALIPVAHACVWFLFGDLADKRNRSFVDLTQLVELAILFVAVRAGLSRTFIASSLTRVERLALALLALTWVLGVVIAAPEPLAAFERTATRLPHLGAAIGICFLLSRASTQDAANFPRAFALQPLLHVPVLILLFVVYLNDPRMNWLGGPVGFWHVRVWGIVLAAGIAAAIGWHACQREKRWPDDLLLFATVLVLTTLLAWSGSRSAMLGLVLAYAGMLIVVRGPFLRGLIPVLLGVGIGVALSLAISLPNNNYGLITSLAETASADADKVSGGRMTLWLGTLDHILDRPLLGHGFDQFRYIYQGEPDGTIQPHNAPLQLMFDFGIPGGCVAMILLLSLWWRGISDITSPDQAWKLPAAMVLNTLAVTTLFDGSLYHMEPVALIALSLGILLSRPRPA